MIMRGGKKEEKEGEKKKRKEKKEEEGGGKRWKIAEETGNVSTRFRPCSADSFREFFEKRRVNL